MADNDDLFAVSEARYGDQYKDDYMTQYRDYVDSAQQISSRRHQANQFFSTINTLLLTASGLIPGKDVGFSLHIAIAGALLCLIWIHMIRAYRDLNSAKFKVIQDMEDRLPLAAFKSEWVYFKGANGHSLTTVESLVPKLFIGAYLAIFIFKLAGFFYGISVGEIEIPGPLLEGIK